MKKMAIGSSLLLFLAACIWGVAFVAQSVEIGRASWWERVCLDE